ncbi:MAG: 50S ribosome-binding GTPase, partial [Bdellovibrionaceae bacterium]|nr:50S ribosome-binding GTPase [Pseudobdellovibrionaceae bacterium]
MRAIGLVGFPNVGKSTLFNQMTGASARVVNYPGSTVEATSGVLLGDSEEALQVWDLPGVYTLSGVTEEEKVARAQALA